MAGGFNPRKAAHDRRNRRFFRKLAHYFIQRELSVACVGCGRCVEVCHGDIGMPNVVEILRRTTAESERHEPAAHLRTSISPRSRSWTGWWRRSPTSRPSTGTSRIRPSRRPSASSCRASSPRCRSSARASSRPRFRPSPTEEELFFTVRRVGSVTAALHQLQPGDKFARARPVRKRLPDEAVLRPEPALRGRRHRPHPPPLLPQLRPGQPAPLRQDPALLRGATA